MFPQLQVQWKLSEHQLQVVWLPVYSQQAAPMDKQVRLGEATVWTGQRKVEHRIPCMFTPSDSNDSTTLIYFHSNAEDIGLCLPLCEELAVGLGVNVLAVEYPGYSYYQSAASRVDRICSDAVATPLPCSIAAEIHFIKSPTY